MVQEAILTWGKCDIYAARILADGSLSPFYKFPTPVDGTTQLSTEAGEKLEAKVEGGGVIATRRKASSYSLGFEIHVGAHYPRPAAPYDGKDGVILGNHVVKVVSEDPAAVSLQFNNCSMGVEMTFDSSNGIRWKYAVDVLKAVNENTLDLIEPEELEVSPLSLQFGAAEDLTGQTITANTADALTASSEAAWAAVSAAGNAAAVYVEENTGAARSANITLTAGTKTAVVVVMQEGV
jgi:hypothetical protein